MLAICSRCSAEAALRALALFFLSFLADELLRHCTVCEQDETQDSNSAISRCGLEVDEVVYVREPSTPERPPPEELPTQLEVEEVPSGMEP
jgi:hypothetical protein